MAQETTKRSEPLDSPPRNDVPAAAPAADPKAARPRLVSLDALRGFDMFWILGAGGMVLQIDEIVNHGVKPGERTGWVHALSEQFKHKAWEGMAFEDLIFPLFVFIAGVSIVFSITKEKELHGGWGVTWRVVRRAILLFVMGVFYSGGLSNPWPDVRVTGVLQRIGLCYLGASLAFCFLRVRGIVVTIVALLGGYWALMTFVPIPNLQLEKPIVEAAAKRLGANDISAILAATTETVTGKYDHGLNLSNYLDARFLPGRKYDGGFFCPEGFLSTLPAVAGCLVGVLIGIFIRRPDVSDLKKVGWLAVFGVVSLLLGFLWGMQFPVVKKIWTSSYVLVISGYSALLLATFYLIVDVWKLRLWCQPFVWIGTNSITIYLLNNVMGFSGIARRLVGGDVQQFFDKHVAEGVGKLVISAVAYLLMFALLRFMYQRKIFLRL